MPVARRIAALLAVAAVAAALAGCGRRGDPEYVPPGGTPAPQSSGPGAALGTSVVPGAPRTVSEPVKPKRPFVLDPLL